MEKASNTIIHVFWFDRIIEFTDIAIMCISPPIG